MRNLQNKISQDGVVLIIALLTMGTLLLLGSYFLVFAITESKISKSQGTSVKTYYLAEAGINEAIWKLKNDENSADGDDPWKICFTASTTDCLDCQTWQDTFVRNYTENSTTTVSIQNSQCAQGEIIAFSTVALAKGKISQRVVKINVLKAIGPLTEDSPVFAGSPSGESTIQSSLMNIYNGNIFGNSNINIKYWSVVNVYDNPETDEQEGQILSAKNINISLSSELNASGICAKNICTEEICEKCPIDSFEMPSIDFDSESPDSYKSKAEQAESQGQCSVIGRDFGGSVVVNSNKCIFSEQEFKDFLWQIGEKGTLILEHRTNGTAVSTYYIEGGLDLKGERYLEIKGILIVDETINIGEKFCWKKGGDASCGFCQITIKDPGQGIPSGLLTQSKINFGAYSSFKKIDVSGLIYSLDEIRLTSIPNRFEIIGGIIARKFSLNSAWETLNIYLNNDIIQEGVWGSSQPPSGEVLPYSPVVTVEHWEETY